MSSLRSHLVTQGQCYSPQLSQFGVEKAGLAAVGPLRLADLVLAYLFETCSSLVIIYTRFRTVLGSDTYSCSRKYESMNDYQTQWM